MDVTGVSGLSEAAAVDTHAPPESTSPLPPEDLSTLTDAELTLLAAKGNTQAILQLEKRHAARTARLLASADEPVFKVEEKPEVVPESAHPDLPQAAALPASVFLTDALDTRAILEVEHRDAVEATKLLTTVDEAAPESAKEAVAHIVDTFL